MNVERLRKMIAYSDKNHEEIYSMVKRFCAFAGMEYDSDLLNVLQIVRLSFQSCIEEYRDLDVEEIAGKYIEGEPQVAKTAVNPDEDISDGGDHLSGTFRG